MHLLCRRLLLCPLCLLRTKWLIALCLCVLVMLLEFLTYHMAYRIGYDEGMLTTPPVVVQKSDEKAMQNLSRFQAGCFCFAREPGRHSGQPGGTPCMDQGSGTADRNGLGLTRELISRVAPFLLFLRPGN